MDSIEFTRLKTKPLMYGKQNYGLGTFIIIFRLYVDEMGITAQIIKVLSKT